jgi:thiol-disulfide isomerase/thioredoxin
MLAACIVLAPTGCASFGKKNSGGDSARAGGDKSPQARATAPADPLVSHATSQELSGLLAGRVVDLSTSQPIEAYVRWECLDDAKQENAAIDMAAKDGFFTIQGLKPGRQYKLTARTKQGERTLAGVSYVTAPNIHVLIKLSDKFATKDIPPLPGPPGPQGDKAADKNLKKTGATEHPATAWEPGIGQITVPRPGDNPPSVQPMQPQLDAGSPAVKQPSGFLPNIVGDVNPKDPMVRIPPQPDPAQKTPPMPAPAMPSGPAPPSITLFGNQIGSRLNSLTLNELNGDIWDWGTKRRGKLVLIDFWFSSCIPCQEAIYHLKALQGQYGVAGLEVIGIACEQDGTPEQQAYRAAKVCQRLQTNYRLLLAGGRHNPVPEQFGVRVYPTMFLLDENGVIVWRHEGGLRQDDMDVLRRTIEVRLGLRQP